MTVQVTTMPTSTELEEMAKALQADLDAKAKVEAQLAQDETSIDPWHWMGTLLRRVHPEYLGEVAQ